MKFTLLFSVSIVVGLLVINFSDNNKVYGQNYYGAEGEEEVEYGPAGKEGVLTANVPPHIRGFIDLDDWTYDAVVNSGHEDRWIFVEVYAPWCGHCERLAAELALVATTFEYRLFNILLVKIDGEDNAELFQRFQVPGYPMMFLTRPTPEGQNETIIPYEGDRTADAISEFIFDNTNLLKRGRVAEMDSFLGDFMSAVHRASTFPFDAPTSAKLSQMQKSAEKVAADLKRDASGNKVAVSSLGAHHEGEDDTKRTVFEFAIIYTKYMAEVVRKGKSFPAAELTRLQEELDRGGVTPLKLDDLLTRINILQAFIKHSPRSLLSNTDEL